MKPPARARQLDRLGLMVAAAGAALKRLTGIGFGRSERRRVELEPGDSAPDFELPGSDGGTYRLRELRERELVVIAWFPRVFTPGCGAECFSLQSEYRALQRYQARYFAATVASPESCRRFAALLGLEYPILSDEDGTVARAYGVMGAAGFPSRWTFYIGADGRIVAVDRKVRVFSHGRDLMRRLAELNVPLRAAVPDDQ